MTAHGLKEALFDTYGGFADLRFKNIDKASRFIVDYRRRGDGDPKVYGNSCLIIVDVVGAREVCVTLTNAVPQGPSVTGWARARRITLRDNEALSFTVRPDTTEDLRSLASAFLAIVARGKRYDKPHYKYSCPRTATSLEELVIVLERCWSSIGHARR